MARAWVELDLEAVRHNVRAIRRVCGPGVEVLAADRHGHATVWVKRFGGPPGTGFVRLWGRPRMPDPALVRAVAEHGLP